MKDYLKDALPALWGWLKAKGLFGNAVIFGVIPWMLITGATLAGGFLLGFVLGLAARDYAEWSMTRKFGYEQHWIRPDLWEKVRDQN